ncbi:uncharacterized protein DNG_03728 [Cephalotrichum gorgonifer]|uniref:CASTOR ACT domain-containing protein n=1 Tax=Cephalotrichum gorgonifer TaxID=2041049 RepID=A0AAE8MVC6_9PEZI|nr:uncharacterized protein DNG_03728 [Cephalotrichum gorgonifer]
MNAQISFLEGTFSLIHIPRNLYVSALQPIIRVLLPQTQSLEDATAPLSREQHGLTEEGQHGFLNVSVNPLECSVVCHKSWAENVFRPVINALPKEASKAISISSDEYLVISVINAGMEAASRVMELTSPLALAGISVFFITTYYSDFILVPSKAQEPVTQALLARGFQLADNGPDYRSKGPAKGSPPSTPPPSTVAELQSRTFDLLRKRNVTPYVEDGLTLVQCSGRETAHLTHDFAQQMTRRPSQGNGRNTEAWLENVDTKLYTAMVSALVSQPRFLSVTLAKDDPPSLLLDKSLLDIFGDSLVGDTEGELVPIFLDLSSLPFEASGIVCGIAGQLVADMKESSGLSYLSTARAGAVILPSEQAEQALGILRPVLDKRD